LSCTLGKLNTSDHRATLAAYDDWEDQRAKADNDPRVVARQRQADALGARAADIIKRILSTPAAGLAGIAVKLRVGSGTLFEPGNRDRFRNGAYADIEGASAMAALLDCERIVGEVQLARP